ncbi:unnamed protein product [Didymodactylos carnosus]|uniref:SPX domain-containing protein n=1 Tax=Didymodactylos carnosus TaxID=1234261 RepID=A0A815RDJ3_9BILA|nr:unnamed protein product [Didymodactylos carnosus]CAF4341876.1 unnamed protein product [Didymodactylos carnosus]
MYGPIPSECKPAVAVIQTENEINHCNGNKTIKASQTQRFSLITPLSRILPDRLLKNADEQGEQPTKLKNTNSLKVAFSEFYLMLILLQKFQLLNFTGFRKILKKHDKLFQTTRGDEWR